MMGMRVCAYGWQPQGPVREVIESSGVDGFLMGPIHPQVRPLSSARPLCARVCVGGWVGVGVGVGVDVGVGGWVRACMREVIETPGVDGFLMGPIHPQVRPPPVHSAPGA